MAWYWWLLMVIAILYFGFNISMVKGMAKDGSHESKEMISAFFIGLPDLVWLAVSKTWENFSRQ